MAEQPHRTIRERLREVVDYPTRSVPVEFSPEERPETVPQLARVFIFETSVDPIRCTTEQFELVREEFSKLAEPELQSLLGELRLSHLAFALADLDVAEAERYESGDEEVLDSIHYVLDDPKERALAEQDARDRAVWHRERAKELYAAAERALGLD
jgi:hypothetical protein